MTIIDSSGQLRELADAAMDDKIYALNRDIEAGLSDPLMYFKKVGQLDAYRSAKKILYEQYKRLGAEEDEDDGS